MSWHLENGPQIHTEVHFDDRRVKCFKNRPLSIYQMLCDAVTRNGEGDAVVTVHTRVSYKQLASIVDTIASNLSALGVSQGDRVAIVLANCPEFVYLLLAIVRLGSIAVPVNVREQTPELEHILNDCGAKVLIHDVKVAPRIPSKDSIPGVLYRFSIGGAVSGATSIDNLLHERRADPPTIEPNEEDVAIILYTSGTTGSPKGAMITHFNIAHSVMHFEMCMGLTEEDRSLLAVPASHVTGLIANVLTMVRVAGCSLILPEFNPSAFLELAAREHMTHTLMVPAMYNLCLLRADFTEHDLTSWRVGGYGGAPMAERTINTLASQLPNLQLMNAYGSTEVTSPATIMPAGETSRHPDSVGWTVPCGDIQIVDTNGNPVAAGEVGEIWIAGPMVVPGYWNDLERTLNAFSNGYWKSGDLGSMDQQGFVRIHDRIKDMINRGGYNVYSAEVENALSHHPDVNECAAIAQPDPVLGEKIHVFVWAASNTITNDDICRFCASRLADYKVPDFVTFLDKPLPRNANGKIMKTVLRNLKQH